MSSTTPITATPTTDAATTDAALPALSRQVVLAARPVGEPTPADFALVEVAVPEPGPGQVVVRNTWMSVDPYMRGRMDAAPSYIPPFEVGAPLEGSAVGEVVASASPDVSVGATVVHFAGWRDHALLDAAEATVVDARAVPARAHLGPLGTTGLTAWVALTEIAPVRPGDVVWVSAAAGAVGSVAGQVARHLGASLVIGSAGGPRKVAALTERFGYDVALDRTAGDLPGQLASAAPDGIDVYVDSVGGDHLEAAIGALRTGGRVAIVGAIGEYNATGPVPGPTNLYWVAKKELTVRGMLVPSHLGRFPEWVERASGWLADGTLRTEETVVDGLERAPQALADLLRGANLGKMLVRLA
jgi:NADPH-dependent curcumin reductase CurA